MGAGLRPKAKGLDKPPDPTVRAPVLDPTGVGERPRGPTYHYLGTGDCPRLPEGRESRPQGEGRQVTSTSKTEEVREMRDAETVLGLIPGRNDRGSQ